MILNTEIDFSLHLLISVLAKFVIGIPTVSRGQAYYLLDTIKHLVRHASSKEKEQVIIVVYIADFTEEYQDKVKSDILDYFADEVDDGVIQLLVAPQVYYPDLTKVPLLYGDSRGRVMWRSKQSLDYSYLYYYCADLGEYYVQLEDDVLADPSYVHKMENFIRIHDDNWSVLEFGARGFIGMTYRGKHLKSLARFVRFYFWTMPVDWLFRVYNDIFLYGYSRKYVLKPPVFKHVGKYSSLKGQVRKLEDIQNKKLNNVKSKRIYQPLKGNPPAFLSTSIDEFEYPYDIEKPYGKNDMFWGKDLKKGDNILIYFKEPVTIMKIVIASGHSLHPYDTLEDTKLSIGRDKNCQKLEEIKEFKNTPTVSYEFINNGNNIKCVELLIQSVRLTKNKQKRWLIVREIAVLTNENQKK